MSRGGHRLADGLNVDGGLRSKTGDDARGGSTSGSARVWARVCVESATFETLSWSAIAQHGSVADGSVVGTCGSAGGSVADVSGSAGGSVADFSFNLQISADFAGELMRHSVE